MGVGLTLLKSSESTAVYKKYGHITFNGTNTWVIAVETVNEPGYN